jgi:hypothetical protein
VKAPLTFAWRNLVFGQSVADAWALYRVHTRSYPGLTAAAKFEVLAEVAGFAASIERDFQLLRVTRAWSTSDYLVAAQAGVDARHGQPAQLRALLERHERVLGDDAPARPEVFLALRLSQLDDGLAATLGLARESLASLLGRAFGASDPRAISQRKLDELLDLETKLFARATDYLDAERASSRELRWLVQRTLRRGVGEPWLDEFWRPQALVLDADEEDGGRRFRPLEADVLRLLDDPIDHEDRLLAVRGEDADVFQAILTIGALPEVTTFPGRQAELLFAPLEALSFPVDACVSARFIPNERALALTRRRVVDADHAYAEESHGDHGPTADAATRPNIARELEEYLTSTDRPPLLKAQIGLAVGAATREELEARLQRLRREYAPIKLHRPLGEQLRLFVAHLPAQLSPVTRYDDVLLPEQLGAMVPTATHAVGSSTGLYIGHTLSGSRQPVLFDVTEASRTSRPPAVLCAGTPGSGKTLTAQLLALHAFLAGSRVVDIDPKGDHRLAEVVGEENVERIELSADAEHRGALDPLRIAPTDLRAELAYSFLTELLPAPVPPEWQTEIRAAVAEAAAAGGRSCAGVVDRLRGGTDEACAAARAITVHAESGLLQLGFAPADSPPPEVDERAVTSLRVANLTLPLPGTAGAELSAEERTGRALLRLLAANALHLMGGDWSRHKVLLFDELWTLLGDAAGLALLQRINRLCRSLNATPILATQMLGDVAGLADLVGCFFAFGVETDAEAARVLGLLGLDAEDAALRARLRGFRRGRCLFRDYEGRVAPVQIDLADPALLSALDTSPRRRPDDAPTLFSTQ